MSQIIDSGQAGGSDPLIDAQDALQSAIDAAVAFNGFVTFIEAIAETVTLQQEENSTQIEREKISALEIITAVKNEALREIQLAQGSAGLYRPADHNPPWQPAATSG